MTKLIGTGGSGHTAHRTQNKTGKGISPRLGVFPYVSHIGYVPPQRVGFLHRFCLNTSIDSTHFGLESGMVFEGTTGVYELIYRFSYK